MSPHDFPAYAGVDTNDLDQRLRLSSAAVTMTSNSAPISAVKARQATPSGPASVQGVTDA